MRKGWRVFFLFFWSQKEYPEIPLEREERRGVTSFWMVSKDHSQQIVVAERSGHFRPYKRSWPQLVLSMFLRVFHLGDFSTGKAVVHW